MWSEEPRKSPRCHLRQWPSPVNGALEQILTSLCELHPAHAVRYLTSTSVLSGRSGEITLQAIGLFIWYQLSFHLFSIQL